MSIFPQEDFPRSSSNITGKRSLPLLLLLAKMDRQITGPLARLITLVQLQEPFLTPHLQ